MNAKAVHGCLQTLLFLAKQHVFLDINYIGMAAARFHLPKSTLLVYLKNAQKEARFDKSTCTERVGGMNSTRHTDVLH